MSNLSPLPFVPSSTERLKTMIEMASVLPGEKAADLGAGDGRVVIALAKMGAEAHGYEIDPVLVQKALENIKEAGLSDKAFIHHQDFFGADLGEYDLLMIYGITSIMGKLEEKLEREMKIGARLVSNYFTLPTWDYEDKINDVLLYRKI